MARGRAIGHPPSVRASGTSVIVRSPQICWYHWWPQASRSRSRSRFRSLQTVGVGVAEHLLAHLGSRLSPKSRKTGRLWGHRPDALHDPFQHHPYLRRPCSPPLVGKGRMAAPSTGWRHWPVTSGQILQQSRWRHSSHIPNPSGRRAREVLALKRMGPVDLREQQLNTIDLVV